MHSLTFVLKTTDFQMGVGWSIDFLYWYLICFISLINLGPVKFLEFE